MTPLGAFLRTVRQEAVHRFATDDMTRACGKDGVFNRTGQGRVH